MTGALPFDHIIEGRFEPARIETVWTDAPRPTAPEIETTIEREWTRRKADADLRGAVMFNGELARYVSHEIRGGALTLTLGPTCYRDFTGTNLYHADFADKYSWDHLANPVGTTATIITADGFLALGRRSDRVAFHAGYLHTVGGALEAADRRPDGTVDVAGSVLRELDEELGLREADIRSLVCVGMIRDHEIRQPELLFEAEIALTRDELLARAATADGRDEHASIEFCPITADAILPFLCNATPAAPIAVGALVLFGQSRWDEDWAARVVAELTRRRD